MLQTRALLSMIVTFGSPETVFSAREPIHHWICVARIERVAHWRFERLIMSWHRPILQTFRHKEPTETVFVQNKRCIAALTVEPMLSLLRFVSGLLVFLEIGNINTGPIPRFP